METKEPFIVSLTHYDIKISVEKDRSDLTVKEVVEMVNFVTWGWL